MKAKAKLLSIETISGKSQKTGKDYSMTVGHFLDLDTYDKMRLNVPDAQVKEVSQLSGKEGVLEVGFEARTEKLNFVSFRLAA